MDKAKDIGESNAAAYLDQRGGREHESPAACRAAYLVNTVDTAREYRVNPEAAIVAYNAANSVTRTLRFA